MLPTVSPFLQYSIVNGCFAYRIPFQFVAFLISADSFVMSSHSNFDCFLIVIDCLVVTIDKYSMIDQLLYTINGKKIVIECLYLLVRFVMVLLPYLDTHYLLQLLSLNNEPKTKIQYLLGILLCHATTKYAPFILLTERVSVLFGQFTREWSGSGQTRAASTAASATSEGRRTVGAAAGLPNGLGASNPAGHLPSRCKGRHRCSIRSPLRVFLLISKALGRISSGMSADCR